MSPTQTPSDQEHWDETVPTRLVKRLGQVSQAPKVLGTGAMHQLFSKVFFIALCVAFCCAQECPDVRECTNDVSELRGELKQKGQEVSKLEALIEKLQADLSAADAKHAEAKGQLSAAKAKAESATSELSSLQTQLTAATSDLQSAQSKLSKTENELQTVKSAAEESAIAGSSCNLSLKRLESTVSEQATLLEELRAVEEALLPLWLSRRLVKLQAYTLQQWHLLQEADIPSKVAAKVAPYYAQASAAAAPYVGQAAEAVAPYWEQAMEASKPAREAVSVYALQVKDAVEKLPLAETAAAAKKQASLIEAELQQTIKTFVASQPSLASMNDPVILQMLVWTVMGLPVLLLLVMILTVLGGPRRSNTAAAQGQRKPAAKAGSKGAQGTNRKGGKVVKAGSDRLHYA